MPVPQGRNLERCLSLRAEADLQRIYSAFFGNHEETALLLPWQQGAGVSPAGMHLESFRVCRACGQTAAADYSGDCKGCQAGNEALVRVSKPHQLKEVKRDNVNRVIHDHDCSYCSAKSALVVFGARAASLSAVAIHQLFSCRDNDDRKLLTFSDSVQDATHRAGFFAARIWQNNVRMALTQLLESQPQPLSLLQVPESFEAYWLKRSDDPGRLELPKYLREFMPPDKRFTADFEHFESTGEERNAAKQLQQIRERMLWQLLEDLGWRSQVGRSLNRLGIAALDWPAEPVSRAVTEWRASVDNTLGYRIDQEAATGLMLGLVQHMVNLGAFGLQDLAFYREKSGKSYLLKFLDYTPPLGPSSPRPRYPALANAESYEPLSHSNASRSWYENWLSCLNPGALADRKQLEHVLVAVLEALADAGVLQAEISERGIRLWALQLGVLTITTDVQGVECEQLTEAALCRYTESVRAVDAPSPEMEPDAIFPDRLDDYISL